MRKICGKCGGKLIPSMLDEYDYQCMSCDEDFYEWERFVIDEDEIDNSVEEIKNEINAREEQMKVCGYGSEELQELIELKNMLDILEGGINDEKENN